MSNDIELPDPSLDALMDLVYDYADASQEYAQACGLDIPDETKRASARCRETEKALRAAILADRAKRAQGVQVEAVTSKIESHDEWEVKGTVTHRHIAEDVYPVEASREDDFENWYITMAHPDGCRVYDGYWQNSGDKTAEEVMQEAIYGASLPAAAPAATESKPVQAEAPSAGNSSRDEERKHCETPRACEYHGCHGKCASGKGGGE